MSKTKKIVMLNDLMARAEQRKNSESTVKEYYSRALGGVLKFVKLPLSSQLDMIDEASSDALSETIEYYKKTIYKHCPLLHDKELQQAYECSEPYDVVTKVFDDDVGDMTAAVKCINSMYGMDEEVEALKNS